MTAIREVRDGTDVRVTFALTARAWRTAFADLLPADALPEPRNDYPADRIDPVVERYATDPDAPFLVATAGDDGERQNGGALAGDRDDPVIGYAQFARRDTSAFVGPDDVELVALYVDPDHWGEGVGSTLLDAGIARLPDAAERVVLQTFTDNEIGRSFYDDRGFAVVGEHSYEVAGEAYPTVVYARDLE